ncbi:11340_t:CDS:2 [Dentiscutata erythropus]|uniref:11340_t:CDS:1 n=1 Tax=Dentiscutata erythropus TaxID=1348616 RepID=A0A9N9GXS4_9GLOM|nr:11340_t:CDS:2 [Dentiscutata erythropus]
MFSSRPHPASIRSMYTVFSHNNANEHYFENPITEYWKNKSFSQHVESANTSSHKNNEPIILDSINKNRPTVDSSSLDSSASNDNFILSSLNTQLRTGLVDLRLNTTRQYLNLVQKGHTKMGANSLLAKSLEFISHVSSIMPTFEIIYKTTISRLTDVVEFRNRFLQKIAELRKQMASYEDVGLNCIPPELYLKIVPVTQDETTLYSNNGQSIHISDFFCKSIGRLKPSEYEYYINNLLPDHMRLKYTQACVAIYPGVNRDEINMGDGGKNRKGKDKKPLRNGSMPDSSEHEMNYIDSEGVKRPKRIRQVLQEQDLWIQGFLKKCNDCKKK